ncbi:MAG: hypothetical protein JSW00_03445 [Thermoplasmata archaeon]|nr:MAG: hypothetical protein JSW00_03445 [Thermoplasmata archaeon]
MVDYDKPLTLSLLAYILWVLSLIFIAISVYVLFYGGKFWNDGILQFLESESHHLYVIIAFSILILTSGASILKSSSWGRNLLIVLCIIVVIHGIIVMLSDTVRGILIVLISAGIIAYMLTSRVSAVFQPIDSRKSIKAIETLESYRRSRHFK